MENVLEIYADKIIEPVDPMRSALDREKIDDLAASIKSQGLINPLTVRPVVCMSLTCERNSEQGILDHAGGLHDKFEIVAGHRRFRACLIAGLVKVPCVVRTMTDQEVFALRAHENLFRDDIDPVDEALYIGKIVGEDESKVPELAKQLNRSVAWVEERLNILTYPDYFLPYVKSRQISLGCAKWLALITDDVYRRMFFDSAVKNGMPVWQAEYYFRQYEAGVFKDSTAVMPPVLGSDKPQRVHVSASCARCGGTAVEPNLKNVFIHVECPPDPVVT